MDNHTVNDLQLVAAAGVIATNNGLRIAIMHQYAYLGKGRTIHSCTQLEHFKNDVDDKSKVFGVEKCLRVLDGTIIPFAVCNGLPYMDRRPPMDEEFHQYPHIILTSDVDWDPSVADHEFDESHDFAQDFPASKTTF